MIGSGGQLIHYFKECRDGFHSGRLCAPIIHFNDRKWLCTTPYKLPSRRANARN